MANELATSQSFGGLVLPQQTSSEAEYGEVASAGSYLCRVQLYGATSSQVKEGLIAMAHYGYAESKDKIIDLGQSFDCFNLLWRPKAMDFTDQSSPVSVFDTKDAEFKRIKELAGVKDSKCVVGPEFLIYVPMLRKFALYHANNVTSQRAAEGLRSRLGRPVTFAKPQFIKKDAYSWHGPVFIDCTTPFDLPEQEALDLEVERFKNPPKTEPVEEAPATTRDR